MSELIEGWQCIGCGRIEVLQSCIGVCQDRRVDLVYAADHQKLQRKVEQLEQQVRQLKSVVRQVALCTPHEGAWERSFKALQVQAHDVLAADNTGS